jgi:hypothetical protein
LDTAAVTITVLVVLLVCSVGGLAAAIHTSLSSTVAVPTATAQVVLSSPSATPGPQPLTGAVLGGDRFEFDTLYGYPTSGGGTLAATYDYTAPNGLQVELYVDAHPGTDGNPHVMFLHFGPIPGSGDTWDLATAQALAATFFPPDAQHLRDVQASNGLDHIYRSARLAATFPASDFTTDVGSHAVPPGTFDYECFAQNGAPGITDCFMGPGQHQL